MARLLHIAVHGRTWSRSPCQSSQTVDDHYQQIYYESIDVIVASIKDRFKQPSYKTFAALETMLLNAINENPFENELHHLQTTYEGDVSIEFLKMELGIFKQLFTENPACCFDDILEKLQKATEEKYLIPNVTRVCKLLLVNPATSATPERSFSLARRVKTSNAPP